MNHYDDRQSYFAKLNEERQYVKCQNLNNAADISHSAYGGQFDATKQRAFIPVSATRADV